MRLATTFGVHVVTTVPAPRPLLVLLGLCSVGSIFLYGVCCLFCSFVFISCLCLLLCYLLMDACMYEKRRASKTAGNTGGGPRAVARRLSGNYLKTTRTVYDICMCYTCIHVCAYVHMYACMHCIYVYIHTCIYIYIYTHVYGH